jgi:hypothetical protein
MPQTARPRRPTHTEGLRVIHLQPLAPAKPAAGAACNGCGWCCAAEPCPLGMLLSRRRCGTCRALHWSARDRRYLCGALAEPARWLPWLPAPWARRLARRWIAADTACDAALEPVHGHG